MSYTKTQWVNNTTPINDTNLNKIEQGIYDNSLVVDAVTNTLNPTDTETYKTAELTEGQITDVIGVNDILIKGQTSQDGTPTPSAPVDVNVVSGSNVVNTGNENLFPLILDVDGTQILQQRCNVIIQKDEFIFTATGTDMYFGNVATANSDYQKLQGKLIKIPANTQNIYLKVSNNAFSNNFICFFDENKVSLGYSNISTSKEVPNTAKYFTLRIGVSNSVSGTTYKTKVMASTMNKAYIPHQGKELPLDLPVENLFKLQDASSLYWGVNYSISKSELLLDGTTNGADKDIYKNTSNYITLKAGTYTISSYKLGGSYKYTGDIAINLRNVDNNTTYIAISKNTNYTQSQVITLTEDTNIYLQIYTNASGNTLNNLKIGLQIEQGSKANAYTPYGTEPIELCKIGNYQDYFYKSGSKWYLHKEVGKYTLNGTNNKIIAKSGTTNNNLFISSVISDILMPANNDTSINLYCSHFIGGKTANYLYLNNALGIAVRATKDLSIGVTLENTNNTVELINTWLASNNVITYYPLVTATDTEITGTLKEQLEAIYNAPLYEQTNITQTNNDLPMVLDITACKDNINGIKAFIRK